MVYKSGQIFLPFIRDHACDRQTDRRTDRRTDRILIAIPRLHYMQRGKNINYILQFLKKGNSALEICPIMCLHLAVSI